MKILLVDDDINLVSGIDATLRQAGYETALAYTAEDGVRLVGSEQPDLILLDVMIPEMGGWTACKLIRKLTAVPIIFLTALGNVENIVKGLEVGADDYMVKPLIEAEFVARIHAHLRRRAVNEREENGNYSFDNGRLLINIANHTITIDQQEQLLPEQEMNLLETLVTNAGRTLSTDYIITHAWGEGYSVGNLKTYIHYLRRRIEADSAAPRWILTVRGVGYRFASK